MERPPLPVPGKHCAPGYTALNVFDWGLHIQDKLTLNSQLFHLTLTSSCAVFTLVINTFQEEMLQITTPTPFLKIRLAQAFYSQGAP